MKRANYLVVSLVALALAACGADRDDAPEAVAKQARDTNAVPPKVERGYEEATGKPGAPFRVTYDVVGTPIVGSPVTVNIRVSTTMGSRPLIPTTT